MKDLDITSENLKYIEENIGGTFHYKVSLGRKYNWPKSEIKGKQVGPH